MRERERDVHCHMHDARVLCCTLSDVCTVQCHALIVYACLGLWCVGGTAHNMFNKKAFLIYCSLLLGQTYVQVGTVTVLWNSKNVHKYSLGVL